ncbi:hypothetical protein [Paenibacillus sp. GbtcB18]|nr:hypothetical protein [Paenibacillus sp. GbtcB18]
MKETEYRIQYNGGRISSVRASREDRKESGTGETLGHWFVVILGLLVAEG